MPGFRTQYLLALVAVTACSGTKDASRTAAGASGGTVVVSTPAEPDNLLPPITTAQVGRQLEDLLFQHLADIGPTLNTVGDAEFTGDLAQRWTWSSDSLSVAFALDPAARWHDGVPVRAADVAFTFALYRDPKTASPTAALIANVDSITVRDSLTAVVWFKRRTPEQFFDVAYQLHILPAHLLATTDRATLASSPFASRPIGSGSFRFVRWNQKQSIELAADTTGGRRRAMLDRVVFTIAPDPGTAFTRVATGEADLYEAVRPDKIAEVAANTQLRLLLLPGLDYSYLGFNLVDAQTGKPHRIFGDRNVRRALTMATDRRSIVANIFDSLAVQARGPFTSAQASADATTPLLPYSVDSANAILDAAGWLRGADSVRRKNGGALKFGILVPSSSAARMRAAVLLQEQFRRIGADVQVEQTDFGGFVQRFTDRKYDAVMGSWHADPGPASVRVSWGSAGAANGGNNTGAYRSTAFDAAVDSGATAHTPDAMRKHFAAAWRIIANDAPAIWLAEPRSAMALNARIATTGMRPDAWWAGIAKWQIAPDKRIARDQPPVATGAPR